eukprot:TRINITY_DN8298_c0_g1_i2.p3 TRINITY_DN8298_c0_g1~~TRINITY_DN8298_c0_g1_i2.p3  ORF type:complete len:111 (+),score=25.75 TRINITY_DN8298_c0_g1_i2:77-409(+)
MCIRDRKTPALKLHKGLQANAKNGLSDMIKSISHFHDHVGFENRVKDPKYELYGELLVKTSSKYDISNQMMAFILTKKEIGAELLKDYNCLLYTSPSPRDRQKSRMPSSA